MAGDFWACSVANCGWVLPPTEDPCPNGHPKPAAKATKPHIHDGGCVKWVNGQPVGGWACKNKETSK